MRPAHKAHVLNIIPYITHISLITYHTEAYVPFPNLPQLCSCAAIGCPPGVPKLTALNEVPAQALHHA